MLTTLLYSVPELVPVAIVAGALERRLSRGRDEEGYSTETILITGGLVLLAIAVLVILYPKVTGTANNINTTPPTVP